MPLQGDRRAGVGARLKDYNFESVWGQRALKATYRGILEEERPPVVPPACLPTPDGRAPEVAPRSPLAPQRAHAAPAPWCWPPLAHGPVGRNIPWPCERSAAAL